MTLIGALRVPMSPMSRAVAFAIALMLAFACLADVVHAVGGEPDGCPQVKLEGQRSPASFGDSALIAGRFELGERAVLARVVHADDSITTPSVFSGHAAPRAPPIA